MRVRPMRDDSTVTDQKSGRSIREGEDRLKAFRAVLGALMRSDAVEQGDVETAIAHLTEVAAEVLRVERASVWRFDVGRAKLICANLYERLTDRHMSGTEILRAEKPAYFAALAEERSVAAHDAWSDPRTSEFTAKYLKPLGITSMLDAPILVMGELEGVVCFEHVGPQRTWQAWEELAAGSFADFVSMVLAAAQLRSHRADLARAEAELVARASRPDDDEAPRSVPMGQLRAFFEELPAAFLVASPYDGEWLGLNKSAKALLGLYEAGLTARELGEIWNDSDDRERLLAKFDAGATKMRFDAVLRRGDGTTFSARITAQAMPFEGEQAIVLGIAEAAEAKKPDPKPPATKSAEASPPGEARDPLTGAMLRVPFLTALADEIEWATDRKSPLAIAVIDPDRMKQFNGKNGYAAGDAVLSSLVRVLSEAVRPTDVVGRYCGAQFMVAMPRSSSENAAKLVDAVRSVIQAEPPELDGKKLPYTVSAGVVAWQPGEDLGSVLARAEDAARAARAAGGDRVVVA
jgi:diguanylate cyclase (GGDEF)-like protein/PAS domain S-box-containing protein